MKNSFVLGVTATLLSAFMGSLNGYVLSKYRIPGGKMIMPLIVFGMFIPYQSVLVPLFRFMQQTGSTEGSGLALVHVVYGLPITTLLFRSFYEKSPMSSSMPAALTGQGFSASSAT